MKSKGHVRAGDFRGHDVLELYLDENDPRPFRFGRFKAGRLLTALLADRERFVRILRGFVGDREDWRSQLDPGWPVKAGKYLQHVLLEFYLDENDPRPFRFGRFKASRLLAALSGDPARFLRILRGFVGGGDDWRGLCASPIITNGPNPTKGTGSTGVTRDAEALVEEAIETMLRRDLHELLNGLLGEGDNKDEEGD